LTEDVDLSFRAQLAGWQALYLPEVEAPAELPPQMAAFKRQQARWATGAAQCLFKLAG
jgi:cellulose synthase/poly-beta-1,6-N-acetylglucosamine synthase-like glycosyltransferase